MGRHAQLDASCCTRAGVSLAASLRRISIIVPGLLILTLGAIGSSAQCTATNADAGVHDFYKKQDWLQVIAVAQSLPWRSGDVNFELGMALAHLQRWSEATQALLAGRGQCPEQKRFPIELAGVEFQQKHYPEASTWIEKGLRIDPRDEYANDFAGTVFLLMDNLDAALKYWNRIRRPGIDALEIDPQLKVQRLLLERAFVFPPHALVKRADLLSTEARLDALGIFPAHSIKLDARQDGNFDAQFHAIERSGFGNGWLQSSIALFSGLPYETVYPSYFNISRSATNFDSLLRWDAQKRRLWLSLSGPLHYQPQWRWLLSVD